MQLDTLTPKQLFDKTGIKPSTQANLRSKGILPYSKIGRKVVYMADDIRKMLEHNRINAA